ncbi:MAG: methylenetetrahydrofolate reductase [Promicromonosporaceae bacterium]|nr:methylenetetrahydrofolate reductase [Promicromonosporaceae bacterium]
MINHPSAPGPAPSISFELMPPRNPSNAPKFWKMAGELVAWNPDFISVTYGAGGATHHTSRAVVGQLLAGSEVWPLAHFTCVGATRADVRQEIAEFLATGTRAFLALRGDPPLDEPNWQPPADGVSSAIELIGLIHEVASELTSGTPPTPTSSSPLRIGVATFPDGNHFAGTSPAQEVERLLAKERAGASFAITQLFYEADTYLRFLDAARAAGVTIPILAGILPATSPTRLHRLAEMTGITPPARLLNLLDDAATTSSHDDGRANGHDDDAAQAKAERQHQVGVEFTAALADEVLAGGAAGIHLYTFNQSGPALDVLANMSSEQVRHRRN